MSVTDKKNPALIKSNAAYDFMKKVALLYLPAVGTLYFALAQIWGLPNGGEVVGSITAIDTFLGIVLHISNAQYQASDASVDGQMNVQETPDKKTFTLDLHGDPNELQDKDKVTFRVKKP